VPDASRRPPAGGASGSNGRGRHPGGTAGLADRVRDSSLANGHGPNRAPAPPSGDTTAVRAAPGRAPHSSAIPSRTRPVTGPARDDIGTGAQDVSEQAERTRRTERTGAVDLRSQQIDETLTRLTAAHAGLVLARDGEDDEPPAEEAPARSRPNALQLLVLVLVAAVFTTTAVGWAAKGWLGSAVRSVAALDEGSGAIRDADAQKGDQNVLVVATDKGPATVVVAHVPAGGGPLTVLSVPADLEISRPPCERFDPTTGTYTGEIVPALARTQLATALDAGGPRCATRAVQQLTGLAITAYVGVDLDRIGPLVDAASGVEVCVTRPVQDRELGPVVPNPGTVTLDGPGADDFVRASEVDGDPPADRGRIERQQQVLAGVLGPTMTSAGLLDLPRVAALRPALGGALTTDGAGLDEVLALSRSLRALGDVGFASVPTTDGGRGGSVLRDVDASALFTALRTHAPLPATTVDGAAAGPAPGDVTVQVLNASGKTGVAAGTGNTLGALGFRIGTVSNADQPTPQTVIRYSPDQAAAADLLSGSIPAASLVPDPGSTGVLQLVLGRSFDGDVRPPAQPESAPPAPVTTQSCSS
jgi:LCP family protein required for cell wall assembly